MSDILADSWVSNHDDLITAAATLAVAAVLLLFLDRVVAHRLDRILESQDVGAKSTTRLRFCWRILQTGIAIVAIGIALQQFANLDRIAAALLASSAIAAAVIGFASRQVIANAVAGVGLAVSQPLRIGDLVTFEGETGIVEDIRVTSTWLRTLADARIVIPNELLATGILRNDSIGTATVAVEVSIWLANDIDETKALAAVENVEGLRARLAESHTDGGIRMLVMGPPGIARDRLKLEGELRRVALEALREAGLR
ncbi:MAG TPA: mechanosensitive ion channel domain-containing protein [Baekduia sp.]|nr:mechanosensitive ion channel domain-containing protein [Baekduia sp.]